MAAAVRKTGSNDGLQLGAAATNGAVAEQGGSLQRKRGWT